MAPAVKKPTNHQDIEDSDITTCIDINTYRSKATSKVTPISRRNTVVAKSLMTWSLI